MKYIYWIWSIIISCYSVYSSDTWMFWMSRWHSIRVPITCNAYTAPIFFPGSLSEWCPSQARQNASPPWLVFGLLNRFTLVFIPFLLNTFVPKRACYLGLSVFQFAPLFFISTSSTISSLIILFIYLFDVQKNFSTCNIWEKLKIDMENNIWLLGLTSYGRFFLTFF